MLFYSHNEPALLFSADGNQAVQAVGTFGMKETDTAIIVPGRQHFAGIKTAGAKEYPERTVKGTDGTLLHRPRPVPAPGLQLLLFPRL